MGICIVLFAAYAYNVLAGKAHILFGWALPRFSDIVEFLLLLAASVALIAAALYREKARAEAHAHDRASNHQGA